jgi:hypothetical protein
MIDMAKREAMARTIEEILDKVIFEPESAHKDLDDLITLLRSPRVMILEMKEPTNEDVDPVGTYLIIRTCDDADAIEDFEVDYGYDPLGETRLIARLPKEMPK